MRCPSVKSKLNRLLDGELPIDQRLEIERHVGECASCRNALERIRAAEGALSLLPEPPDVPQGFSERVLSRSASGAEKPVLASFWTSLTPAMRVAAAAVLALGLVLGLLMGQGGESRAAVQRGLLNRPKGGAAQAELDLFNSLDYFADVPGGSLADAYVRLATDE